MLEGRAPRRLAEGLLLFLILFSPRFALAPSLSDFDSSSVLLMYCLQALPQIGLFALLLLMRRGSPASAAKPAFKPRHFFSLLLRSLFLAALLWAIASILVLLRLFLGRWLLAGTGEALPLLHFSRLALLPLVLLSALCTGYREELFFRALLIPDMEALKTPSWLPPLFSAFLFSLAHAGHGWFSALNALCIGLVLGLRFRSKRDIHELALAHAAYDLAVILSALA